MVGRSLFVLTIILCVFALAVVSALDQTERDSEFVFKASEVFGNENLVKEAANKLPFEERITARFVAFKVESQPDSRWFYYYEKKVILPLDRYKLLNQSIFWEVRSFSTRQKALDFINNELDDLGKRSQHTVSFRKRGYIRSSFAVFYLIDISKKQKE